MALELYIRENQKLITTEAARTLLRCAVFFQNTHKGLLSVGNPRPYKTPSRPGEYPRVRTGALKGGVLYLPTTVAEVARLGYVRVGYARSVFYGLLLEFRQRRLGLLETLRRTRQQLAAFGVSGVLR